MANPLSLLDVKMCVEKYNCIIPDGDHLIAEQNMREDNLNLGLGPGMIDSLPSMLNFNGTDSPTFTYNRPRLVFKIRNKSPKRTSWHLQKVNSVGKRCREIFYRKLTPTNPQPGS